VKTNYKNENATLALFAMLKMNVMYCSNLSQYYYSTEVFPAKSILLYAAQASMAIISKC